MKKWFILLFAGMLIFSCKNNNEKNKKMEKTGDTTGNNNYNADSSHTTGYTWKKAEQNKFLEDCEGNIEGKVDSVKMKNFCSCMLTQAQKYYPGYKQMEDSINNDFDNKISLNCLEKYPGDKDDE